MNHEYRRSPLFCDTALAERIEHAETRLVAASSAAAHRRRSGAAGFAVPIAGGVASFAEPDSPFNKVAGLGFAGVPAAEEWDRVEEAFGGCGAPVQVELATLADPAVGESLTGRGYRLVSFENVLGRSLAGTPDRAAPPGIQVRPIGDGEFEPWVDMLAAAAAQADTQGLPDREHFPHETFVNAMRDMAAADVSGYLALRDGVIAGGGTVRLADGIAQLGAAATLPEHRRRGVHTALLAARLADARAAGCDIAVVTTQPGSRSQQNVQRQSFDLLYTRAVLVKEV